MPTASQARLNNGSASTSNGFTNNHTTTKTLVSSNHKNVKDQLVKKTFIFNPTISNLSKPASLTTRKNVNETKKTTTRNKQISDSLILKPVTNNSHEKLFYSRTPNKTTATSNNTLISDEKSNFKNYFEAVHLKFPRSNISIEQITTWAIPPSFFSYNNNNVSSTNHNELQHSQLKPDLRRETRSFQGQPWEIENSSVLTSSDTYNFKGGSGTTDTNKGGTTTNNMAQLENESNRIRRGGFGAILRLWNHRRDAFAYVSTQFYKIPSRLKADALEMATIQLKMPKKDIWRCLIAELIGTCLLIIMGCGSILTLSPTKALDLTGIGLCWGLTVATLAQTLGHVSGCHLNPAVSLAMFITGRIQLIKAGLYIIVQCLGAMIGAAVLKALTPDTIIGDWGKTSLGEGVTPIQGFGIEFVATFVLLMVIFGATDDNRNDIKGSAPLAIGLCITALVLFCGPFTGASMNPARSLGPSVVAGHWDNHWVYWIGPISGAISAATLYHQLFRALSPEEIATIQAEDEMKKREDTKEGSIPNV